MSMTDNYAGVKALRLMRRSDIETTYTMTGTRVTGIQMSATAAPIPFAPTIQTAQAATTQRPAAAGVLYETQLKFTHPSISEDMDALLADLTEEDIVAMWRDANGIVKVAGLTGYSSITSESTPSLSGGLNAYTITITITELHPPLLSPDDMEDDAGDANLGIPMFADIYKKYGNAGFRLSVPDGPLTFMVADLSADNFSAMDMFEGYIRFRASLSGAVGMEPGQSLSIDHHLEEVDHFATAGSVRAALRSEQFAATSSEAGLLAAADKAKIDALGEAILLSTIVFRSPLYKERIVATRQLTIQSATKDVDLATVHYRILPASEFTQMSFDANGVCTNTITIPQHSTIEFLAAFAAGATMGSLGLEIKLI